MDDCSLPRLRWPPLSSDQSRFAADSGLQRATAAEGEGGLLASRRVVRERADVCGQPSRCGLGDEAAAGSLGGAGPSAVAPSQPASPLTGAGRGADGAGAAAAAAASAAARASSALQSCCASGVLHHWR